MFSDAIVRVTCDECYEDEEINPEYVYRDYSGKNGYYDTDDYSLNQKLPNGWVFQDDKHYCETCATER